MKILILFILVSCQLLFAFKPDELITHVKKSILNAENYQSKLNDEILNLKGLSGFKVRHLLNNICSMNGGRYLEIGVWKGSTFISALYKNQNNLLQAIAIDNWILGSTDQEFKKNTESFLPNNSFKLYEGNCFKIDLNNVFKNKINIYFYDGEHFFNDHVLAFTYFDPIFEDNFIAIVDDYNWKDVQEGTQKAFKDLNYKIMYQQYIPAVYTNWFEEKGWWNGIYIAVISKNNKSE